MMWREWKPLLPEWESSRCLDIIYHDFKIGGYH